MPSFLIPMRNEYQNLNVIHIDKDSLLHNFHTIQNAHPEALLIPVLKSNAYGHGLELIGKWISQELKPPFICVDSLYEAYKLQKAGVKTQILILGYTFPQNFTCFTRLKNIHVPVFDLETAEILNRHQPGINVHLKIDTGMHRLGFMPDQFEETIDHLKQLKRLNVVGIYSHLAQADNPKKNRYTQKQIAKFKTAIQTFETHGFHFTWKHISASSGALPLLDDGRPNPNFINDPEFNLIRVGLSFYGYSPFSIQGAMSQTSKPEPRTLRPALTLKTHIAQIKTIEKGSEVSYGGTFTAKKRMKIGVLPIGYYDGLNRKLSNLGKVMIYENTSSPVVRRSLNILGRICMNMCMIDLSEISTAKVGDEVEIISSNPNDPNSVTALATQCDTIPYEVLLSNLSETTKRILV